MREKVKDLRALELLPGAGHFIQQEKPEALNALRRRGYQLDVSPPYSLYFGGVHAVLVRDDGVLVGVADPRRDGAAVGY